MGKDFYIKSIEKNAGALDTFVNELASNKSYLSLLGAGTGALGTAYMLSDKDDKQKIKDGYNGIRGKQKEFNKKNSKTKKILRSGGALAGTALALKGGKSLPKAIADGGIAGTAIGDMVGSTVLPAMDLYKEHKKEFGTAPDIKSMAKVVGANAIPSAALWGSVYGLKHGAIKKNISKTMNDGISNAAKSGTELAKILEKYNGRPDLINEIGKDVLEKKIGDNFSKIIEGAVTVPLSMMPIGMFRKSLVSIPGSLVTSESEINKKKQEIENKSINSKG